jgi:DNA-binding transcriptional LysR family regulator
MLTTNVDLPEQITVCGTVSLLKALVAETDHLALLPAHAVEEEVAEHRLCILPFEDATFARDIAVFFREGYLMDQGQRDLLACIEQTGLELCRQPGEHAREAAP